MRFSTIDTTAWDSYGQRVGVESGRDLATLNYVLLILGFFTAGITAVAAVVLAYMRRGSATPMARSHLDHQVRLFWGGLLVWLLIGALHWAVVGLGAVTFGIGLVFLVVPWTLGVLWLCWTGWGIIGGMRRLSRALPM
jgi:uncharacterized membrane protein